MKRTFTTICLAMFMAFTLGAQDKVTKAVLELGRTDNRVMERINTVMYGVQLNFGVASAMSWIYFAVALLFIAVSALIITKAVKSYE